VLNEAYERIYDKARDGLSPDVLDELRAAELVAADLRAAERQKILAEAKIKRTTTDPFDVFTTLDADAEQLPGWYDVPATEEQQERLAAAGIKCEGAITKGQAKQLLAEINRRHEQGLCTYRQARQLLFRGFTTTMTFEQAWATMDYLSNRPGGMKKLKEDFARCGAAKKRGRLYSYDECDYLPRYLVPEGIVGATRPKGSEEWTIGYETRRRNYFTSATRDSDGNYIFHRNKFELRVRWQDVVDLKAKGTP